MASKIEKNTQIFTGILAVIYLVVIITDLFEIQNFASITLVDVLSTVFFLVFLFGAVCCLDYPLVTAITFLSWIALRLFSEKLLTGDHPSYGGITIFYGLFLGILGIIYLFIWWDKRDKFES